MKTQAWHQHIMGTEISIHIVTDPARGSSGFRTCVTTAVADTFEALSKLEYIFSPYITDSQISRIHREELTLHEAEPIVREVARACREAELASDGRFSAWFEGHFDPTGYVKGWATEYAANLHLAPLLEGEDIIAVGINAGGDMQLYSAPNADWTWNVGIAHPQHPGEVIATVKIDNGAVATSGTGERGAHLIDPRSGVPATDIVSTTVVASSLTDADVWATVSAVAGSDLGWVAQSPATSGIIISANGNAQPWSRAEIFSAA